MISGFVHGFPYGGTTVFNAGTARRSPRETRQKRRVELPAALHASWRRHGRGWRRLVQLSSTWIFKWILILGQKHLIRGPNFG